MTDRLGALLYYVPLTGPVTVLAAIVAAATGFWLWWAVSAASLIALAWFVVHDA